MQAHASVQAALAGSGAPCSLQTPVCQQVGRCVAAILLPQGAAAWGPASEASANTQDDGSRQAGTASG